MVDTSVCVHRLGPVYCEEAGGKGDYLKDRKAAAQSALFPARREMNHSVSCSLSLFFYSPLSHWA